jgi:hypothetical protein
MAEHGPAVRGEVEPPGCCREPERQSEPWTPASRRKRRKRAEIADGDVLGDERKKEAGARVVADRGDRAASGQQDVRDEDGHGDAGAGQQLVRVVAHAGLERADTWRSFTWYDGRKKVKEEESGGRRHCR